MTRIYYDKCGSEILTENDINTITIYGSAIKRKTGEYVKKINQMRQVHRR